MWDAEIHVRGRGYILHVLLPRDLWQIESFGLCELKFRPATLIGDRPVDRCEHTHPIGTCATALIGNRQPYDLPLDIQQASPLAYIPSVGRHSCRL